VRARTSPGSSPTCLVTSRIPAAGFLGRIAGMTVLRTPEDRFADLPDWPYQPRYVTGLPGYEDLRMAYVDEGPRDGDVVLCLHGEPSWGYLYRRMIPVFSEAGLRVVVPDWFGFGRSDKPAEDATYTWDFHRGSLVAFVERLGLERVTLVVQDWGGLLGLTLPVTHPHVIGRLLLMNTGLAVGKAPTQGFLAWRDYMANTTDLDVAALMKRAEPTLTDAEAAAYAAPFPDASYKAGVRRFPQLVPTAPDQDGVSISRQAAAWWANEWNGATFMAIGENDAILGSPVMQRMREIIRGCPEPMRLDAGHFVPEHGEAIARAALATWV
jgi:pimeloyl-ACP methyl ester carboxylesterase